jgi:hypothetical protein
MLSVPHIPDEDARQEDELSPSGRRLLAKEGEYVRVFSPMLAALVGLNEAIFLYQLQYWLERSQNEYDGRRWRYATYQEWLADFPFWSDSTLKRTVKRLEDLGVLISTDKLNRFRRDRTKWYTIDYDQLDEVVVRAVEVRQHAKAGGCPEWPAPSGQNDQSIWSNRPDQSESKWPAPTIDYGTDSPSKTTQRQRRGVRFGAERAENAGDGVVGQKMIACSEDGASLSDVPRNDGHRITPTFRESDVAIPARHRERPNHKPVPRRLDRSDADAAVDLLVDGFEAMAGVDGDTEAEIDRRRAGIRHALRDVADWVGANHRWDFVWNVLAYAVDQAEADRLGYFLSVFWRVVDELADAPEAPTEWLLEQARLRQNSPRLPARDAVVPRPVSPLSLAVEVPGDGGAIAPDPEPERNSPPVEAPPTDTPATPTTSVSVELAMAVLADAEARGYPAMVTEHGDTVGRGSLAWLDWATDAAKDGTRLAAMRDVLVHQPIPKPALRLVS